MKITFLLPYAGVSGGIRVVSIYAQKLSERGHEVTVVTLPHWLSNRRALIKDFFTRKLLLRAKGKAEPTLLDTDGIDHRTIDRVRPFQESDVPDADVIISTWWETAAAAAKFSDAKGAKVYFLQGYDGHSGQPVDQVNATWSAPMQKIAVSQWLADKARDEFDDDTVALVPNSVDTEMFHAPPRDRQSTPTVGMLYSCKEYRGCPCCIEAVNIARDQFPNLRMLTFGMGPHESFMPLPEGSQHFQLPSQDEIRQIYARCDAWLFGSHFEGFGLPILEAMACRTPVIATPGGAAPQLLASGGGKLVAMDDAQSMADAIIETLTCSDDQWRAMSDRAYVQATSYTWDNAADLFEAALERARAGETARLGKQEAA